VVAGRRIVIAFDDADPGVPHGLVLYADASRAEELARAPSIVGPDHARFEIPALRVGRYLFSCRVHPRMQATLRVDPG